MPSSAGVSTGPYHALRKGRIAVDDLMAGLLEAGGMFLEETATQILLRNAYPRVMWADFPKKDEAEYGADWLWWWVDQDGVCFGLLVQAKILKKMRSRWIVDFSYKTNGDDRTQISKLIKASDYFRVPPAYVLYCGDGEYRSSLKCARTHDAIPCRDRDRVGVAFISALAAEHAVTLYGKDAGVAAFHDAVPVEDIASPDGLDSPIVPLARDLAENLRCFLQQPQRGARRVAKEILRPVQQIRNGQFAGAVVMQRATPVTGALFEDVPNDYGHFSAPYLAQLLRGLRTDVPEYVQDVMEGRTPPTWVTERVAGIVVIPNADAPSVAGGGVVESDEQAPHRVMAPYTNRPDQVA